MLDFKRWFSFTRLTTQNEINPLPAMIEPYAEQRKSGAVLVGVATDLSLNAYDVQIGAKEGPDSIRRMLAKYPLTLNVPLYDAGVIDEQSMEWSSFDVLQSMQYQKVREILQAGHFPVVLGGGHEVAIASYRALSDTVNRVNDAAQPEVIAPLPNPCASRVGIVNIDANFQLRRSLAVRSGSAFHSVASFCQSQQREFRYLGLGICDHTNSQSSFAYASELGAKWLLDSEMKMKYRRKIQATVDAFVEQVDHIHLSLDLAVFSSAVAEGVNMSRVYGVSLPVIEMVLKQLMASGKVRIMDVAGLYTEYDYQGQTARLAAKLIQHSLKNI
ncbi:arginase family protein [Photobacterium aquae]|uniref:arginase family protein n=1 Tax=Photobacterium aquae TaxID=1195763 RepID=UPI00069F3D33|nr:arginase family protein [Photobacterium aquae]